MIYEILTGLGIGLTSGTILYVLLTMITMKTRKTNPILSDTVFKSHKTNILAFVVFITVLYLFRNPVPALLAVIVVVYMPSQINYLRQRRFKQQVIDQLSLAVSVFANNFVANKNIPRSIEAVGRDVPAPVGTLFKKTYSELIFGVPLAEAAERLGKRLGISYGFIFGKLLVSAQNQGDIVEPLFRDLSMKIINAQEEAYLQSVQVTTIRKTNIAMLVIPIPFFIFLYTRFPDVMNTLSASAAGRLLFSTWLIAIIICVLLDRVVLDA